MEWTLPKIQKVLDDPKTTLLDAGLIIGGLLHHNAMLKRQAAGLRTELHERAEALDEAVNLINEGGCENCGCRDPLRLGKFGGYFG